MGTEISFHPYRDCPSGIPPLFVRKDPKIVLAEVYRTHAIHSYEGIVHPIGNDILHSSAGLNIRSRLGNDGEAMSNLETQLSKAKVGKCVKTEERFQREIGYAIDRHLMVADSNDEEMKFYLNIRNTKKMQRYEEVITHFLEIVSVALGISIPIIDNLKSLHDSWEQKKPISPFH